MFSQLILNLPEEVIFAEEGGMEVCGERAGSGLIAKAKTSGKGLRLFSAGSLSIKRTEDFFLLDISGKGNAGSIRDLKAGSDFEGGRTKLMFDQSLCFDTAQSIVPWTPR